MNCYSVDKGSDFCASNRKAPKDEWTEIIDKVEAAILMSLANKVLAEAVERQEEIGRESQAIEARGVKKLLPQGFRRIVKGRSILLTCAPDKILRFFRCLRHRHSPISKARCLFLEPSKGIPAAFCPERSLTPSRDSVLLLIVAFKRGIGELDDHEST